jgi:hypothetical protein
MQRFCVVQGNSHYRWSQTTSRAFICSYFPTCTWENRRCCRLVVPGYSFRTRATWLVWAGSGYHCIYPGHDLKKSWAPRILATKSITKRGLPQQHGAGSALRILGVSQYLQPTCLVTWYLPTRLCLCDVVYTSVECLRYQPALRPVALMLHLCIVPAIWAVLLLLQGLPDCWDPGWVPMLPSSWLHTMLCEPCPLENRIKLYCISLYFSTSLEVISGKSVRGCWLVTVW